MCLCYLDTCFVVLLQTLSMCKLACAAIARAFGGVVHIFFRRSSGVLAKCSSDVLASKAAPLDGARTPLEHLARTPLERQNEMCKTPPKTLAMAAQACLHTHTHTTPHSKCPSNTHTYTPRNTTYRATARVHTHTYTLATSQRPTNHTTNQPTN